MKGPPEKLVPEDKNRASFLSLVLQLYIYIYILCVCVCVCVKIIIVIIIIIVITITITINCNCSGEISPTGCNKCVFYSQWLYSTCFG